MLADAVVDIAAAELAFHDHRLAFDLGVVRTGEVGRTADHARERGKGDTECIFGPVARALLGGLDCSFRFEAIDGGFQRFGLCRSNGIEQCCARGSRDFLPSLGPSVMLGLAARSGRAPRGEQCLGHNKRAMRPAESLARASNFFGAERRAVRRGFTGFRRCAKANGGFGRDQPRFGGVAFGLEQRSFHRRLIMAVDIERIPPGGLEAADLIFAGGE